jgi:peptidoglycan/LPS O-acetylase OafA/YrhL
MSIAIAAVSILAISAITWLVNRMLSFTVCPICAGVFLTWAWLVGAYFAGYGIDPVVPALLMGGSVVGIAYQLEKKSKSSSAGTTLLWKALFIPAGFIAAYAVLEQVWTAFLVAAVFLLLVSLILLPKAGARVEANGELEKKMEDCC